MPKNREIHQESPTKTKIRKIASTLFSQYGYKGTSVRKIAAEVGIRESALYNHFKNKEEIFLDIAQEIFASPFHLSQEDTQALALRGKVFLQKFTMYYKMLTFNKTSEIMFRLLLIELMQNEELRKQFIEHYHTQNIKLLSEGFFIMMQHNLIRSSDPMMLAYEYISTLFYIRFQITLLKVDAHSTNHLTTQFEKHVDFFWESIKI